MEDELERLHEESFGWALSCTGWNEADAEDVLQTTYMRVISGKARFEGRSGFRTWLFGVIRMVALEQARRVERRIRLDASNARHLEVTTVENPTEGIERSESTIRLTAALNELPDRQREILHLVFYEEMTIAQAAEVMGVSVGSARTHYTRGKARVRQLLEGGER